jgi:hypothetical protein
LSRIYTDTTKSIDVLEAISTVASSKIWSFFDRDGQFLALQMDNFSLLHDEERLAEVCHQLHSIELVIALQMGLIIVDFRCTINFSLFRRRGWAGTHISKSTTDLDHEP